MKKEIELKYRFASKTDFDIFSRFLTPYLSGKKRSLRQENCYFDTPTLSLKRAGISLRLRRENSQYLLCAKQSLSQIKPKNHLSVRFEYEGVVDHDIALLIKQGFLSPLDAFATLSSSSEDESRTQKLLMKNMRKAAHIGLQMIGCFANERCITPVKLLEQKINLEFDHATYPNDIEAFELEVEFSNEKQASEIRPALEALFLAAHIKTYRSQSKSSRLFQIIFPATKKLQK